MRAVADRDIKRAEVESSTPSRKRSPVMSPLARSPSSVIVTNLEPQKTPSTHAAMHCAPCPKPGIVRRASKETSKATSKAVTPEQTSKDEAEPQRPQCSAACAHAGAALRAGQGREIFLILTAFFAAFLAIIFLPSIYLVPVGAAVYLGVVAMASPLVAARAMHLRRASEPDRVPDRCASPV